MIGDQTHGPRLLSVAAGPDPQFRWRRKSFFESYSLFNPGFNFPLLFNVYVNVYVGAVFVCALTTGASYQMVVDLGVSFATKTGG